MKILLIVNLITLVVLAVFLTILLVSYRKANKTLVHTAAELAIAKDERDSFQSQLNAYTKPNQTGLIPEVYNLIASWCKETGVKQVAAEIKTESDMTRTLVVYSDRPGLLIGKAGCIIDKYAKAIKSLKIANIKRVVIKEIYGIVNQFHIDVDKYYNTFMTGYFAYEEAGEEC